MIKVCSVCGNLYYHQNQYRKEVCKECYRHVKSNLSHEAAEYFMNIAQNL